MQDQLKEFYNNIHQRDAFHEFLVSHIEGVAIARTFSRKPVDGLADAKDVIEQAFAILKEKYGEKTKPVPKILE